MVRISRRALLLGAAASWMATGCASDPVEPGPPAVLATGKPWTVDGLLAEDFFVVAHRGSGDNRTEHTMAAYAHAVERGAHALEVSVNATSDGVLVCHHDTTTVRTTPGVTPLVIAETTWAELSAVRVDARAWLGPQAELEPIPKLVDVLDRFAAERVIFIDDKQGTNTEALLKVMKSYPDPTSHFVWKQWAGAAQYKEVKAAGFTVWGYFTPDLLDRFDDYADRFDLLGIPTEASDRRVSELVAKGRPVIAWEVHNRSERRRLARMGVVGIMCSNLDYVTGKVAPVKTDAFATGLRAAGDLPWTTARGWAYQPSFDLITGALRIGRAGVHSYSLGSLCPIEADHYRISFELRWPDGLPDPLEHAGLAFGQADDRPYRVRVPSDVGGYHLIFRANGGLELFSREAGTVEGTQLGVTGTSPAVSGEWVRVDVEVSPTMVRVSRSGLPNWVVSSRDKTFRGGYISLGKNYSAAVGVEFRAVTVTEL